jgi:hypothetical protein
MLGAPAIAVVLDDKTLAQINHVVECTKWLLAGDARYVRFCQPSRVTQEQLNGIFGTIPPSPPSSSSSSSSTRPDY